MSLNYLQENNFFVNDLYCAEAKQSDRCASLISSVEFNCLPGYLPENNEVKIAVCLEDGKWSPVSKCVKCISY